MTQADNLVNWSSLRAARAQLGDNFLRILGYFEEDGTKSVAAIENAMRDRCATGMVIPAHTLKGESSQFGAVKLMEAAEHIETVARHCIEARTSPDDLLADIASLRTLFERTLATLKEDSPQVATMPRRAFGQRTFGNSQRFGQA